MNAPELYVRYFEMFFNQATARCRHFWENNNRPNGLASSFESLLAFKNEVLSLGLDNPSILDAGAGASSCMLRFWFSHVTSCDPDSDYIAQVRNTNHLLSEAYRLPTLVNGDYETGFPARSYDAIFYDYGQTERPDHLDQAIQQSKLAYFDDTDHRPQCEWLRGQVIQFAGLRGRMWRDGKEAKDEFSRWGVFVR